MKELSNKDAAKWLVESGYAIRGEYKVIFSGEVKTYVAKLPSLVFRAISLGQEIVTLFRPFGNEALLLLTEWEISDDMASRKIIEGMRRGYGIGLPLADAPGHLFHEADWDSLYGFAVLPFLFDWDAYLTFSDRSAMVFKSHDDFVYITIRTTFCDDGDIVEFLRRWDFQPETNDFWIHYFQGPV